MVVSVLQEITKDYSSFKYQKSSTKLQDVCASNWNLGFENLEFAYLALPLQPEKILVW